MAKCSVCGRLIQDGYNVSRYNLERHEQACPGQRKRELRKASTALKRVYRSAGMDPPLPGQLPLPDVEGALEVVG